MVQEYKTHNSGFMSALEFGFVVVRMVLNVLERRKKTKSRLS
jgi:hypothetical protein